jgi:oxygen-independent coproporphyrinogen-3 oxidase
MSFERDKYAAMQVPRYTSYPTAPAFHGDIDSGTVAGWIGGLKPDDRLSFYFHVPFCQSMCWYCGCHTKVTRKKEPVLDYARSLRMELETVLTALGPDRQVAHIHWGGGTPTMMPAEEFLGIHQVIDEECAVEAHAERAIEIDPRCLTDEMADMFVDAGINRASLGVQDFTPRVQAAIGRTQPYELVHDTVEMLAARGINGINFDLMYGLPFQRTRDLLHSVDLAVNLQPQRIALFGYAHVPWFKKHQRLIEESALPNPEERLEQAEAAADRLVTLGYERIGLDHFALPEDSLAIAARIGKLRRNFQGYTDDPADAVIGLGASSISTFPQGFAQNSPDFGGWARAIESGRFATIRGLTLTDDDRLRADAIERLMCDLAVDLRNVTARHGVSPHAFGDLQTRLQPLVDDGIAQIEGDVVRVPEQMRPFTRLVASAFDAYFDPDVSRHSAAV